MGGGVRWDEDGTGRRQGRSPPPCRSRPRAVESLSRAPSVSGLLLLSDGTAPPVPAGSVFGSVARRRISSTLRSPVTLNSAKRHEMGAAEINRFLTDLAVNGHVSASTQNQAFAALQFLYRQVLQVPLERIRGVVRANRPRRLPVVLSREEVRRVLASLDGVPLLICNRLYGAGCGCSSSFTRRRAGSSTPLADRRGRSNGMGITDHRDGDWHPCGSISLLRGHARPPPGHRAEAECTAQTSRRRSDPRSTAKRQERVWRRPRRPSRRSSTASRRSRRTSHCSRHLKCTIYCTAEYGKVYCHKIEAVDGPK